jgi:hypothetical protein
MKDISHVYRLLQLIYMYVYLGLFLFSTLVSTIVFL